MVIQGVNYPSDFEAKKLMIETGRRMDEKGYVVAEEGSISVRVGPNAVWITAEKTEKGALKQEHFIRVDMNGKQSPGSRQTRLPEDLNIHLAVYSQNPELRAVIHGYPVEAVVFAAQNRELPAADYSPSVRALGRITLVRSRQMEDVARKSALACRTDSGILISGDGCVMWGKNLTEAFCRIGALEYYGKVSRLMQGMETRYEGDRLEEKSEECLLEGLTPVIRPDGQGGFQLPTGAEKPFVPAKPDQGAVIPEREQAAAPPSSRRDEMMAEVVRRTLASL